jgi:hypothetical protein
MNETTSWQKLQALPGKSNPCLNCPPIRATRHMESVIAVGFGSACVTCDNRAVYTEPRESEDAEYWTTQDAEDAAMADPGHDWRIVMFGPLHGEEYQRHGPGEWVLVESNEGFA